MNNASIQQSARTARRVFIGLTLGLIAGSLPLAIGTANAATTDPTSLARVVKQIKADALWAAGFTGEGVDVAIIDTGVAPVTELSTTNIVIGPDFSFEGGDPAVSGLDTYGHGTHIAGIIAGRTPGADPLNPRDTDFIGVAPDARLVSVKVGDNTGAVDVSQVIAAIDWVIENRHADGLNIRVLNLSYNTSGTQSPLIDPLSKAVENAWKHGIVVVVAAGNDGRGMKSLASPANNPFVIAVSAATRSGGRWSVPSWATTGDGVRNPDVLAPGVSIRSLRVPGSRIDVENPEARTSDGGLFFGSGTSQATAVVSGAAALLLEQRPDLTPDQVKDLLKASAVDLGMKPSRQGSGAINLQAAMARPATGSIQTWPAATGLGSLEAARGDDHVTINGATLKGEVTITGAAWDAAAWAKASESGTAWSGSTWSGSTWSGSTWSGSSWSGSSWSGSSWSGSSWS